MSAPGLIHTNDGGIDAILTETRNAPLRDREKVRAIAQSLLLHTALFLALLGGFSIDLPGPEPSLSMPLEVELVDGRDLQHNDPSPIDEPAPTPPIPEEQSQRTEVAVASVAGAPHSIATPPSTPAPGQPEEHDVETVSEESVPGEAPAPQDSDILASAAEEGEVPLRTDDPAEPQRVPMPVSEQVMVTRRIMQGVRNFEDPSDLPAQLSWSDEGQSYTAVLDRQPAASETEIEYVSVEVQAGQPGQRMRTRLNLKRLAFSHFTQLVDRWDTQVQLHDDQIEGRFHSNSAIVVGYDRTAMPKFFGKVTTAARGFDFGQTSGYRRRSDMFQGGFEARAGRINLPARFVRPPGNDVQARAFPHDTRITFYADGSYGWTQAGSQVESGRQVISAPTYLIGGPRTTLYLKGVVAGQVTVYSPDRIVIEGDLTYAHDPRAASGAQDCLGLVSSRDIEIALPRVTGKGDLQIDAALYARRRFVVSDIDEPAGATLYIYGSLTAGSLSATEPRYATKITFDPRFESLRPPGFPATNRYEIEDWDPSWEPMKSSG